MVFYPFCSDSFWLHLCLQPHVFATQPQIIVDDKSKQQSNLLTFVGRCILCKFKYCYTNVNNISISLHTYFSPKSTKSDHVLGYGPGAKIRVFLGGDVQELRGQRRGGTRRHRVRIEVACSRQLGNQGDYSVVCMTW